MTKKYDEVKVKQIKEILNTHSKSYALVLKSKKNLSLYEYILNATKDFDIPFNTRIYWVTHEIYDFPICDICKTKRLSAKALCHAINGYKTTRCSISCAMKDPEYKKRIAETNLKRYGETNPNKSKSVKEKISKTRLAFSEEKKNEIRKKREQTNLKRYGVKVVSQNKTIAEKAVKTFKTKSTKEKEEILEKIKQTKLIRYNDPFFNNNKQAMETRKKLFEENPESYESWLKKRQQTLFEKYGTINIMTTPEILEKRRVKSKKRIYNEIFLKNDDVIPLFSEEEYLNATKNDIKLKWKCKYCNSEFECIPFYHQPYLARCLKCFPMLDGKSKAKKEIVVWIKSVINEQILTSDRTTISPKELDIYIPEKKLAIEFDELYWHSANLDTPTNYHLNKTELCEEKGIQLIHIFENEWDFKQEIVKSRLKNLLGIYDKTVFARKCEIRKVDSKTSKKFQEENHIQGAINASVSLGLYFDNELISLMTFGKTRFSKKYEWELLRFCNKLGYHIPGAAGKLLKHFEENWMPKSLVSYADRRWSVGKLYKALGFTLEHISPPNYWYWNINKFDGKLESRIKYQKHKLPSLLEKYDGNLTETENMRLNGFMYIYDCGNLVFVKTY